MTALCAAHQRASTATCTRCGVFLCDWCVKLAPDWGRGLCSDCLKYAAPRGKPFKLSAGSLFLLTPLALFAFCITINLASELVKGRFERLPVLGILVVASGTAAFVIVRINRR